VRIKLGGGGAGGKLIYTAEKASKTFHNFMRVMNEEIVIHNVQLTRHWYVQFLNLGLNADIRIQKDK
jgi:hypothetical protein